MKALKYSGTARGLKYFLRLVIGYYGRNTKVIEIFEKEKIR